MLQKHFDLIVYNFGEYPRLHQNWGSKNFKKENNSYKMKIFGRGAISFKTQINPSMIYHLKNDRPDIVISVAFWIPSLYESLIKKVLGYKFLIITDAISAKEKNISITRKIIRRIICKNTDAVISASQLTSECLNSLCPKATVYESLQTINVNEWNNDIENLPKKETIRENLNLPKNKIILSGVGSFISLKNWDAVFEQIKDLSDCLFVLIDGGKLKLQYKKYIESNSLHNKVLLVPRKEAAELKYYFKVSDVFISPSMRDTFGYVIPEALASGLPVVCSENAGASSLIENGVNGYIINPQNNFSKEIKNIIEHLTEMKKNALQTMKDKSLENKADEFTNILNTIMEKK